MFGLLALLTVASSRISMNVDMGEDWQEQTRHETGEGKKQHKLRGKRFYSMKSGWVEATKRSGY